MEVWVPNGAQLLHSFKGIENNPFAALKSTLQVNDLILLELVIQKHDSIM